MTRAGPVATATIAYAEVYAGLTRKRRDGPLSARHYGQVCRQFEQEWRAYIRVELREEILGLTRDLIQRHPLRGFDAIHLASALSLKGALGEEITFAAADERLLRAAEAEHLQPLHVERTQVPERPRGRSFYPSLPRSLQKPQQRDDRLPRVNDVPHALLRGLGMRP